MYVYIYIYVIQNKKTMETDQHNTTSRLGEATKEKNTPTFISRGSQRLT